MKFAGTAILVFLTVATQVHGAVVRADSLAEKYQKLLLFTSDDYRNLEIAARVFEVSLRPKFNRAVRNAKSYAYPHRGVPAYFHSRRYSRLLSEGQQATSKENGAFLRFFNGTLPMLAFAYLTPGPNPGDNPYYRNDEVLRLYLNGLEYCYSRGLTEEAWLPDSVGRTSVAALESGLVRSGGDFSSEVRRLAGFIQSIFLMREALADSGLLDKYRAVVRNLVVNNGLMYYVFYPLARAEVKIGREFPPGTGARYFLNADGIRLFTDYFWPYFLLIDDVPERNRMTGILMEVIAANIAIKPGTQSTIKPDGTGYHHSAAYVGAYSPFAFEAMAQLLYLTKGTGWHRLDNVEAVRLALESYRVMVQRYSMSSSLRGRLIGGTNYGSTLAVARAMGFLGHPDGTDDAGMRSRFAEFFDRAYFLADERIAEIYEGGRGLGIRGLGLFRLLDDLDRLNTQPAAPPVGAWIKPYGPAGFFRRGDWLVTAKGFSQYFWDYEGPLDTQENSFGQNWAYGLLQVFSAGTPVSELGSGYDHFNGWDWYHVPGTTASHYPIEAYTEEAVQGARRRNGIVQRATHRNYNSKTFVGGVTIGDHGLFVQDLEALPFTTPTDLTARKSYFFVGDKVLALGSDIRGGTAEDETHTTIFQTRLAAPNVPTSVNGERWTGLGRSIQKPPAAAVAMTDSVGNSYYLASSTSELVLSRKLQRSMTPKHVATEGAFAQAYINHGINPRGDVYQYVVIPADRDGAKLQALASDPTRYFRVLEHRGIHVARFPEHGISGYAFFEPARRTSDQLVRGVNLPAAVMTQEKADSVILAVSVPDIGWRFERGIVRGGLSYASVHFARQEARVHRLEVELRGRWRLAGDCMGIWLRSGRDGTIVTFRVSDGLSRQVCLVPVE